MLSAVALVLLASCGGGGYDAAGLASGGDDITLFVRGSQQYFRGARSASREVFSELVADHPDSPLADDALLAVRRIDQELGGLPDTVVSVQPADVPDFPPLALVGQPGASSEMARLVSLLNAEGCVPVTLEDPGAPGMTLVLYPEGSEAEAQRVADSLSVWLTAPLQVGIQPGDNVIPTVAPGHEGIVVVVGTDAYVDRSRQARPGAGPAR